MQQTEQMCLVVQNLEFKVKVVILMMLIPIMGVMLVCAFFDICQIF